MATYAEAGVDVKRLKKIHAGIEEVVKATKNEFSFPLSGHYAGIMQIGKEKIAVTNDGVGSKILVAEKLGKFDTVGIDCVAMVANDIICVGARPVGLVDYIALQKQDEGLVLELMNGLADGCREAGCAILGGETAILPEIVNGFDLEAACIGRVEGEVIDGSRIKPGHVVIGLESSGLHSNGYTLARKILDAQKWGREMLAPTRIYVKPVLEMLGKCEISGLANITGGGFSKMGRLMRHFEGGFLLDGMPVLSGVFSELFSGIGKNEYEMYRTFNCGIGFCVICPDTEAQKIIGIAKKHGIKAQAVGKVTEKKDIVLKKDGKSISLL